MGGQRYGFLDPDMSAIWKELFSKNRVLARLIAYNTTPAPGNVDWCRPFWVEDDRHSLGTDQKIKKMNDTATELVRLVDELEAVARRKWISIPIE
jgi:hypothetical protein